jgi:predicted nucleotidyltransferase
MPIPELNETGLLPEGIHDCTLDEIGARFGRFQVTDRRIQLFEKLRALVEEEKQAGLAIEMIVDGSFVTGKPDPGDIDLVIVLPEGYNFGVELPPFRYNATSKSGLHRRYRFDVAVVEANSTEYEKWIDLFQKVKFPPPERKGILRITL